MRAVNLLLTSAGRRVELVRAFRAAYERLGLAGRIVATDIDPLAPALRVSDIPLLVPPTGDPGYVPRLLEICHEYEATLCFPLIDPDIPVLARHARLFADAGTRVGVLSERGALIVSDKRATADLFVDAGVRAPRTWLPDELPERIDFPVYVKPRFGSAAAHTYAIHDQRELGFFIDYVPDPIVQDYLPGPEVTCDLAYDLEGRLLGLCQRRRIAVRAGEVQRGVTVWDDEIARGCISIGAALGAVGPITVQCMYKDGAPRFTEINGRFGGGLPLAVAAGLDFPAWYLSLAAGLAVETPPLGTYTRGLYMTRFDDSFFLSEDALRRP